MNRSLQFTGSYSYSGFRSCIPINPWDSRATSEAINQASCAFQQVVNNLQRHHRHLAWTRTKRTLAGRYHIVGMAS
jgi:hypothetical protein